MVKLNVKVMSLQKSAWEVKLLPHKKSLIFALALFFCILPFASCCIRLNNTLPDKLAVVKGANCNIKVGSLVSTHCNNADVLASGNSQDSFAKKENGNLTLYTQDAGSYDVELKLLGVLPIKKMSVDVIEDGYVIPGGEAIGIKIHTEGVIVVKLSEVEDESALKHSPAKDAGVKVGDIITAIDGTKLKNADHFKVLVDKKGEGGVDLEIVREGETITRHVNSVKSQSGYKVGAWIRDSTAGIGTLTFIKPDTNVFASLGHGISDIDTGRLLTVSQGSITEFDVTFVARGQKGEPGEIRGVFENNDVGVIKQNSSLGIYGVCNTNEFSPRDAVKIATRFEVQPGKASIICTVDENGPVSYDIEIEKVMTNSSDVRGMVIRVSDERLLEKTGGIVQGMSGSPILQDGRLVGAVTHVFVNDPTRGYGIFIENMMDEAQKIK